RVGPLTLIHSSRVLFFFFTTTSPTDPSTLSLHDALPILSAQAWCMAGSIHEGKWLGAGMSHVLEHMLFKGTHTRPGSRIDQEVRSEEHTSELQSRFDLVCRLLLEKKKKYILARILGNSSN